MEAENVRRELVFLLALWKANLLAAMEYRAAFISQVLGMMLNNAIYFVFWVIFFDRFKEVRGWGLSDMMLLFGIVAISWGASAFLFGNAMELANVIASGRLDYYLSLPRPVLLHVLASRSITSGLGDFVYGLLTFAVAGHYTPDAIARFVVAILLSSTVLLSFLILVQSLAFWLGNASMLGGASINAILTFSLYPISLFDGSARFILFTILPGAFIGALPAEFVRTFSWQALAQLLAGAGVFLALAVTVFQRGLRRYESGSAIQVQV
ncbi:MAG: ABC-2 family transporter protein [Thermoflexales bacterium]|nr:ABC-2 family transporter protein [Thermoflexales bacterium]